MPVAVGAVAPEKVSDPSRDLLILTTEQVQGLTSSPVSQYGPPEEPNYYSEQPTAYSAYGQQPPGAPPPGPPEEPQVPWYRKPWALILFGALGAIILVLIILLVFGGSNSDENKPLTPLTTTSGSPTATTTPTTTPSTTTTTTETTTPTTTGTETTTETTEPTTTTSTSTATSTTVSFTIGTNTVTIPIPPIPGIPNP